MQNNNTDIAENKIWKKQKTLTASQQKLIAGAIVSQQIKSEQRQFFTAQKKNTGKKCKQIKRLTRYTFTLTNTNSDRPFGPGNCTTLGGPQKNIKMLQTRGNSIRIE